MCIMGNYQSFMGNVVVYETERECYKGIIVGYTSKQLYRVKITGVMHGKKSIGTEIKDDGLNLTRFSEWQ